MSKLLLFAVMATLGALLVGGCSDSGSTGGTATEVKPAATDTKPTGPAQPPPGVTAAAAKDSNAFADAMKRQAQQGTPK